MSISWNVILPVILIELILMAIALVDLAKTEKTNGPKLMWVTIIVLGNLLGTIAYFIFGRRNS
ncbi:PLDc_N domain-containing protein [Paenibacillus psychroresistens]|uniref:PLDc_N domain-containing protein n=1 Tax=Paenibacillus psychroresistens TaxID=1778678 RepID=A0A6B8RWW4_9BACL|nr:PLD nuclease N-terminal domain-containing protein [Paenibacillus psychroresistens]QGQ99666.1 PLDc_N domain-containing protein [Paenibacillus psychroresistens]